MPAPLRHLPFRHVARLLAGAAALTLLLSGCAGSDTDPSARAAERQVLATAAARCIGAAARDPERPCTPRDRLAVRPRPQDAIIQPNAPCRPLGREDLLYPCVFGRPSGNETVALVGDSHASHWRAAVAVVARAKGWQAVSLTRSSCPFSAAIAVLPQPQRSQCIAWNAQVHQWFRRHPEVHTVFVSEHSGGRIVVPAGRTSQAAQISGYLAAWKALPHSITRLVVIRDTPRDTSATAGCIERAAAAGRAAGPACAVPRGRALKPDPAIDAAARMHQERVQVVDLTSLMCDARQCFPVVGGVLVHKDIDHLTEAYSASLGPYLLRAVDH